MSYEIDDIRARWQDQRQRLLKADFNLADEYLAQIMFFADHNPIISGILKKIRTHPTYKSFDAQVWFSGRGDADVLGAGDTRLGFSLEENERIAQSLKVLELIVQKFNEGGNIMWMVGNTISGRASSHLIDKIESVITNIFDPFYQYIVTELRSISNLITPLDMARDVQSLVDNEASINFPLTHKLLTDAYKLLFSLKSTSGNSWNTIGYKCRDILIEFSKEVFDLKYIQEGQEKPKGDDAKSKLKIIARYFLKNLAVGDTYQSAIEDIIQTNWEFVVSVGHRQASSSENDARLSILYTYISIYIFNELISKKTIVL